jgi:hypothetical protein
MCLRGRTSQPRNRFGDHAQDEDGHAGDAPAGRAAIQGRRYWDPEMARGWAEQAGACGLHAGGGCEAGVRSRSLFRDSEVGRRAGLAADRRKDHADLCGLTGESSCGGTRSLGRAATLKIGSKSQIVELRPPPGLPAPAGLPDWPGRSGRPDRLLGGRIRDGAAAVSSAQPPGAPR